MSHSEIIFSGSQPPIDSRVAPHLGALFRHGVAAVSETDGEATYGRKPRTRELSAAESGAREGLSLLVHWLDPEGGAHGQLQLTGLVPQPPLLPVSAPSTRGGASSSAPPSAVSSMPLDAAATLRVHVEASAVVLHPFSKSPICEVPLLVVVQNCDRAAAVGFTLDLAQIGESPSPTPTPTPTLTPASPGAMAAAVSTALGTVAAAIPSANATPDMSDKIASEPVSSGEAFWLGCTRIAEHWIEPNGVATLPLRLAVCSAGTFTLDGFRLSVCGWKVGANAQPQRPTLPVACPPPPACTVQVVDGVA